jgi:hypothetical protein
MCYVTEEDESSAVWSIIRNNLPDVPPSLIERVNSLSSEIRSKMENKLAGPLIGKEYSVDETFLLEHDILNRFVDFKSLHNENSDTLLEEMNSLSAELSSLSNGGLSNNGFLESSLIEMAQNYLKYWIQICKWSRANDESVIFEKVLERMKRVAAMFSIGLNRDDFLIHGHGHEMMINQESSIADAGCWIEDKGSFIKIDNGEVTGHRWPKR